MNAIGQFLRRKSVNPGLILSPASTHLGDDDQAIRIRMESLLDNLIGHMGTVKVAGIDMVYAGCNGLAQNGNRAVNVTRRPKHLRACELHRAIAHTVHRHRCAWEREAAAHRGAKVYL